MYDSMLFHKNNSTALALTEKTDQKDFFITDKADYQQQQFSLHEQLPEVACSCVKNGCAKYTLFVHLAILHTLHKQL